MENYIVSTFFVLFLWFFNLIKVEDINSKDGFNLKEDKLDSLLPFQFDLKLKIPALRPAPIDAYNCSNTSPPLSSFTCQQLKQGGLCGYMPSQFCALSCETCCIDINPYNGSGGFSCSDLSFFGFCDQVTQKGYCLRTCNACNKLIQVFSLTALKLSIQYPDQLQSWSGWDVCNGWDGVICHNGEVAELRLGKVYFNIQTRQWIDSNPKILNNVATSIPAQLSLLEQLYALYLDVDGFTGKIPPELSALNKLLIFDVCWNKITGNLPQQFSAWTNTELFLTNNNYIVSSIPEQFSTWKSVIQFYVQVNKLTGSVPLQFSTWQKMGWFIACDKDGNYLCIPSYFKEFTTHCPICGNQNRQGAIPEI